MRCHQTNKQLFPRDDDDDNILSENHNFDICGCHTANDLALFLLF